MEDEELIADEDIGEVQETAEAQSEANPDGDRADIAAEASTAEEDQTAEEPKTEDKPTGEDSKRKPKHGQSRADDAEYAKLKRLLKEEREKTARLEKEKSEADFNRMKGDIPSEALEELGMEGIETEADMALAKAWVEAKNEGSPNPARDAYRKVTDEARKREAERQSEEKRRADDLETDRKDHAAFVAKFGNEAFNEVIDKNSEFFAMYGDFLTHGNATALYEKYVAVTKARADKAKADGAIPTPNFAGSQKQSENDMPTDRAEFDKWWKKNILHQS